MSRFARLLALLAAIAAMLAPPHAGHGAAFDPASMLCGPASAPLTAAQRADLTVLAALVGEAPADEAGHDLCDAACSAGQIAAAPPSAAAPVRRAAIIAAYRASPSTQPASRPEAAHRPCRAPPVRV